MRSAGFEKFVESIEIERNATIEVALGVGGHHRGEMEDAVDTVAEYVVADRGIAKIADEGPGRNLAGIDLDRRTIDEHEFVDRPSVECTACEQLGHNAAADETGRSCHDDSHGLPSVLRDDGSMRDR